MKEEKKLKEILGSDDGMQVPPQFFTKIFIDISDKLPSKSDAVPTPKPSPWIRLRPYIYMAAMFAGIWCTMKMVHMISSDMHDTTVSLDNPPELVAQAISDPMIAQTVSSPYEVEVIKDDVEYTVPGEAASDETDDSTLIVENEDACQWGAVIDVADLDLAELKASLEDADDQYFYI